jgi:hypothetical protein
MALILIFSPCAHVITFRSPGALPSTDFRISPVLLRQLHLLMLSNFTVSRGEISALGLEEGERILQAPLQLLSAGE